MIIQIEIKYIKKPITSPAEVRRLQTWSTWHPVAINITTPEFLEPSGEYFKANNKSMKRVIYHVDGAEALEALRPLLKLESEA